MPDPAIIKEIPTAFISYSWDDDQHKQWVVALGARLRSDGIDLILDEWSTGLGDRLPHFMERAIRDSDYVVIVCTPSYKERSDARRGGVGFEGHIITAELFDTGNERKFLPALRAGDWSTSLPTWMGGKKGADLRGEKYSESEYAKIVNTIHRSLPGPPPVGPQPSSAIIQSLDIVGVTNQRTYADLVNSAIRTHQAASQRLLLLKSDSAAGRAILPKYEEEVERFSERVSNLAQEIDLLSSIPVGQAARDLAAQVVAIRMFSTAPALESKLQEAHRVLIEQKIPKFREEVRRELSARGSYA